MVLHAPGDRAVDADFGALHIRDLIGGEDGRARRTVSTSSRCTVGALNTSGLPTYIGCLRPGSVSLIRPKPISRPFGFLRTAPPAATVSTCRPQQLPNTGVPDLSTARVSSICLVTAGLAS